MISSLRGGASIVSVVPPVVVSSVTASSWVVSLPGGKFECLEEFLMLLGELGCRFPFEMGLAGLFFPLLERPRDFCGRIVIGGINDGACESFV